MKRQLSPPLAARIEVEEGQIDAIEGLRLSDGMRRVLLACLDHRTAGLSNEALGEKTQLSATQVGRIRRDPLLMQALEAIARDSLARFVPALLAAAIDTGTRAGRDGYWDRRMLLDAAGITTKLKAGGNSEPARLGRALDDRIAAAVAAKEALLRTLSAEDTDIDGSGLVVDMPEDEPDDGPGNDDGTGDGDEPEDADWLEG